MVVILLLMVALPKIFPGKIEREVKAFANQKLNGELNFTNANLSFFDHFPSLTLTLEDFSLKGSPPFPNEDLVSAAKIAFGIDVWSLVFSQKIHIDQIFLSGARVNVKVNKNGEANYNVYVSDSKATDTSQTSLKLSKIAIEDSYLRYDDQSVGVLFDARGFNYTGKGDLDQSVFDLKTSARIDSLDFSFDGVPYLRHKKVSARLITQINTHSLAFVFAENDLKINKLPVVFTGKFDFLKNGYDMYFNLRTQESQLRDFFTALPPQYVKWLETSQVKGQTSVALSLKGQYIASQSKMPTLSFNMKIRDGELKHQSAPVALSNIFLNLKTTLPSLDPNRLRIDLDSLYFNAGKDYLKAIVKSQGLERINLTKAHVQSSLNLARVSDALMIDGFKLAGHLKSDIRANGIYDGNTRQFPITSGKLSLAGGLVKTPYYPNAIQNIQLAASLTNPSGRFADSRLTINRGDFVFEGKPFTLFADFVNFDDVAYNLKAKGEIDVARVYQVFAIPDTGLQGRILADVSFKGKQSDATQGRYQSLENRGTLTLQDIRLTTAYLVHPFVIRQGNFEFNQDQMNFSDFKAGYASSDFAMDGQLRNVINFVLSDREVLKGKFSLTSQKIAVDEFMTAPATDSSNATKSSPGVVVVPPNLDVSLTASARQVLFQGLELQDVSGTVRIANNTLSLERNSFSMIGCRVGLDARYKPESARTAHFDFAIKASDFDIKRAYNEVALFKEMASAAAYAEGIVSLDYKLKGKLGAGMSPIYPSLEGGGVLSVKNVKMKGFRLMNVVSRETNMEGVADPDVSKVDIKTQIRNNIITIDRFKFKVAGFRPRIEGQTSLDGKLNLKMRLGLPPLGIIGIPLTVTGTQDDPKVKLGRKTQDLEETEYNGEAPVPAAETPIPAETSAQPETVRPSADQPAP